MGQRAEGTEHFVSAMDTLGALLNTFYDSVVTPALFFGVVCWRSSISIMGCPFDPVEVVSDNRMAAKLPSLLNTACMIP